MIFLAIGLGGGFSDWVEASIAALLDPEATTASIPAPAQMLGYEPMARPLDEIGRLLVSGTASHLAVGVKQPDDRLHAALAESGARFVLALDQPRRAVADLATQTGAEPSAALRAVANGCAAAMRFAKLPGALLLHGDNARAAPEPTIAAIARHFGLAASEAEHAGAAARLASAWAQRSAPEDWADGLPAPARRAVEGALGGYEQCFAGRGLGQLVWNRDLFMANDPTKRASELLDLAGGSRILVFGPYIHLPPGAWTAEVTLGVSAEAAGCRLVIDVYAGSQLAAETLEPAAGGIFTTEVNFVLPDTARESVEVRITVMDDNAEGRLAFGRAVLHPIQGRRPDMIGTLEDFDSVLGL